MNKTTIIILAIVTLLGLTLRLYKFNEPNHYYFDEVYHAVTAKAYADNNPAAYDPFAPPPKENTAYDWLHPPLAKLIQAGSINIFGDNSVGWRLPSVIFGTAIIPATFLLAFILFGPTTALFAALVISLENLNFVMSRITMNDVFVTFFILMAFSFFAMFIKSRKTTDILLSSVLLGLAFGSKWTGLYAVAAIGSFYFIIQIKEKKIDPRIILLAVIPPVLYLLSYGQFWLQGHTIEDFVNLHKQIWWYQNRHDLQHPYGTTPIFCVPKGLNEQKSWCPWPLNIRGVYFSYEQYGTKAGYIYALGNPLIFWGGILSVSYMIGKIIEKPEKKYLLPTLGYFIFWVPWIFSPRIMFLYHYLPAIPFMAVTIGFLLKEIHSTKYRYLSYVVVLIFFVVFFYFYPISSGWPIEINNIDQYMWLKTWR